MPEIAINKRYDENNISSLIGRLNFIFDLKGKLKKDYEILINVENQKDFTAITTLLLYKFVSFAIDENCLQNPYTNLDEKTHLFSKYNLHHLIQSYLSKDDKEKLYSKITPITTEGFLIAPHPISKKVIKNKEELDHKYYQAIESFYSIVNNKIADIIKTCIVEVASNFHYHAEHDMKSILMAEGDFHKVEIVSIDTSEGIIETLRNIFPSLSDTKILENAFKRRVSSKLDKNHCGTGLWLINEITSRLKGKLIVHSGKYVYRNIQGKIRIFASSYWQGTVLYIKLPITNVSEIEKFLEEISRNEKKYI